MQILVKNRSSVEQEWIMEKLFVRFLTLHTKFIHSIEYTYLKFTFELSNTSPTGKKGKPMLV